MLFIYNLERYEFLLLLTAIIVVAGVCYYFAVRSRKTYTCPECGEKFKVEHMVTDRCGMCGSLLTLDKQE